MWSEASLKASLMSGLNFNVNCQIINHQLLVEGVKDLRLGHPSFIVNFERLADHRSIVC